METQTVNEKAEQFVITMEDLTEREAFIAKLAFITAFGMGKFEGTIEAYGKAIDAVRAS